MRKFNAKAYIRIRDNETLKSLTNFLDGLGYECVYGGSVGDNLLVINKGDYYVDYKLPNDDFINCDEYDIPLKFRITLFSEIAQFNKYGDGNMLVECCECDEWHRFNTRTIKKDGDMTCNYCPNCGSESIFLPTIERLIEVYIEQLMLDDVIYTLNPIDSEFSKFIDNKFWDLIPKIE